MNRTDIAGLLRTAARAMPKSARDQFVKFLATLPGGKAVRRSKVHSWHRSSSTPKLKAKRDPRQGRLL